MSKLHFLFFILLFFISSQAITTYWTGLNADNKFSKDANWSVSSPGNTDDAVFNATNIRCYLDKNASVKSITFTSGYTGEFDFASNKITINGSANFATGGTITATGGGTLDFNDAPGLIMYFNPAGHTFPDVQLSAQGSVAVTSPLNCTSFLMKTNNGSWDWGNGPATHTIGSMSLTAAVVMNFGTYNRFILNTGDCDLSSATTLTSDASDTIKLTSTGAQTLKPMSGTTLPHIKHTGTGNLTFATNNLTTYSFRHESSGSITFAGFDVTTVSGGDFILNQSGTGTVNTINDAILTITGNCLLSGTATNTIDLNAASGHNWTATVTGRLEADYADLNWATATNSNGILLRGTFGANTTGWIAAKIWTNGGGTNNWNLAGNWVGGIPGAGAYALFTSSYPAQCNIDAGVSPNIGSIEFRTGYNGTFNFNGRTLTLTGTKADFSGLTTIQTTGADNLTINTTSTSFLLTPKAGQTLPAITKSNTGTVTVLTNALWAGAFTQSGGTWDWGDYGQTHIVTSIPSTAGTMDFGTSTVQVSSGSADLSGLTTITPATGTLEFKTSTTQTFTPHATQTCPAIVHSNTGTLTLGAHLICQSFSQTSGSLNFGSKNITATNNISITGGTSTTITGGLAGINIRSNTGSIYFEGTSSVNRLNMTAGSAWHSKAATTISGLYVTLTNADNSSLLGPTGFARYSDGSGGGNSGWIFENIWTNGNGNGNWGTADNWSSGVIPGSSDSVIFDGASSMVTCNLNVANPTIEALTFNGTYTGTLAFSTNDITVTGNINMNGGEAVTFSDGAEIILSGGGTRTFVPKNSVRLPDITMNATGTITVSTANFMGSDFSQSNGVWDWGDQGKTHALSSITTSGGTMDFGNSIVQIDGSGTVDDVNLSGLGTLTAATGTLDFKASTPAVQILTAKNLSTHPNIRHTGTGRLQFANPPGTEIIMISFYNSAGDIDFNSRNVRLTTGNFTITTGGSGTIYTGSGATNSLRGITITVPSGDATLDGTNSGNLLNLNPDLGWNIDVQTGNLTSSFSTLGMSTSATKTGISSDGTDLGTNTNWNIAIVWTGTAGDGKWSTGTNWSGNTPPNTKPDPGDPVMFNTGSANCTMDANPSLSKVTFTSGYTGAFSFNGNTMTITGNADFRSGGAISGGGTLTFSGTGTQTFILQSGAIFPDITHSGTGTVTVTANALTAQDFSHTSTGKWDWGDAGLIHEISSITASAGGGEMDFGTSTVKINGSYTSADVNVSGLTTLTQGTGTLEFIATAPALQTFTAKNGATHPNIRHTGTGRIKFAGAGTVVQMLSFYNSDGFIDLNGQDLTTVNIGNFTITNGSSTTMNNAGGTNSLNFASGNFNLTVAGITSLSGTIASELNINATKTWNVASTGSLNASYASVDYSNAAGLVGYAVPATDGGNNTNWYFARVWDGSTNTQWGNKNNWTAANIPNTTIEPALFHNLGNGDCDLDANYDISNLFLTSSYTGKFSFSDWTLSVLSNSDLSSGSDIIPSAGTLKFNGTNAISFVPRQDDTLPNILLNGPTVTVATRALTCNQFRADAGTWNWGSNGYSHFCSSIDLNGGTVNFGNSTVRVLGHVDLSGSTVNAGTGVLDFIGSGTQNFTPNATSNPAILHSGSGTLVITANLTCRSFAQNNGILNFNSKNITTTGDFSITSADHLSITGLGSNLTIIVGGNCSFSGVAGDSINLDASSVWKLNVTGTLGANYSVIKNSDAASLGGSAGTATLSRNAGNNPGWNFTSLPEPAYVWVRNDLTSVAGAAIGNSKIYVAGGNTLHAILLSNSNTDWTYTSGNGTCGMPSYTFTTYYQLVFTQGNWLYRFDDDGTPTGPTWSQDLSSAAGTPYISPNDNSVYVMYNNSLSKRSIATGAETWNKAVSSASNSADIVVFDGYVLTASTNGTVSKYDATSGLVTNSWSCGTSISQPLLVQGGAIYITPDAGKLYKRNGTTLNEWSAWWTDGYEPRRV